MKVYVAGASSELELVERYIYRLIKEDIVITHNWCSDIRESFRTTFQRPALYLAAQNDVNGVRAADIFWLIIPKKESRGCWVEYGIALVGSLVARQKTIISGVVGPKDIFLLMADQHFDEHEQAFEYIVSLAK